RLTATAVRTPSGNPLLRLPVFSALYEQRWVLLAWVIGTMLLAAFVLSLARSTADLLRSNQTFQGYLQAGFGSDPNLVLLALVWLRGLDTRGLCNQPGRPVGRR